MKAFLQLYLASLKEFMRDRMAMFWTLAFPIFFILIFGLIFSGASSMTFDVGVAVEDKGQVGSALGQAFHQVDAFKITEGNSEALLAQLKDGDLRLVIVIPEGLSKSVAAGQAVQVKVYYDASSQNVTRIALTITEKIVEGFDRQLSQRPTLLTLQTESVTASNLRDIDFILPGILAMSLMQLGLFGTAPALVQLREQQVLRRLGATPLPRLTLLAAQVLHRITIGITQTFTIILVGRLLFKVAIVGPFLALVAFVLVGAFMFVAMGYFISGLAKTQESVMGISQLINFPMMFLSGVFFPVDFMPAWLKPVVTAMPLTYLADALRQIMVGATPTYSLGLDFAVLSLWLVGCGLLAMRFFRWE